MQATNFRKRGRGCCPVTDGSILNCPGNDSASYSHFGSTSSRTKSSGVCLFRIKEKLLSWTRTSAGNGREL